MYYGGAKLVIIIVVALTTGIHRAIHGPRAVARRRLKAAARRPVDGATVTLNGIVRVRKETLSAPLSGETVVAFASTAQVREGNTQGHMRWIAEAEEIQMVEFTLETRDGSYLVEGRHTEIEVPPIPIIPRKLEREAAFLKKHGYARVYTPHTNFEEARVVPDMKVSVHGIVRIEPDPTPSETGYREMPTRAVLYGSEMHPITIGRPVR